jgi:hypothetical protein
MFETKSTEVPVDHSLTPRKRIMHLFDTGGDRRPMPGDKALCGYVKRTPRKFVTREDALRTIGKTHEWCVVCLELDGGRST